jgi:putative peptide zinc metalloprotease protein
LINIPNLYTLGQKYIQYLNQRYLQGRAVQDPVHGQRHAGFIRIYGVTALLWRWLVTITLIVLAHLLWHGAGVVLAIIAVLVMFVLPLLRFLLRLHSHPQRGAIMRRLVLLLGVGGGLLLLLLQQIHWSPRLTVPAVLDYAEDSVIRAESPGVIAHVAVQPGQTVQAGAPLIILDNPTLVAERDDLALQVSIHTLKQQQYLTA